MSAAMLARLSGIHRRDIGTLRVEDLGIQRAHDADRTVRIRQYLRGGYPWADLSERRQAEFEAMRKPGWLPTAVVLNLNGAVAARNGRDVSAADRLEIQERDGVFVLALPDAAQEADWKPESTPPIEVIDGQHRILAFLTEDGKERPELAGFELPFVCFDDLDLSWEAYLFWSINISPKKIGPSLAYDLFPLLRTQDWLDESIIDPPQAYRESRAQELTEALWASPRSPWHRRIAMLGRSRNTITQAAWVRSLSLSLLRRRPRSAELPGGLFSANVVDGGRNSPLPWSRAQQAAFLIVAWTELLTAVEEREPAWAVALRAQTGAETWTDALLGQYSLLATDQGVRGYLQVLNDLSVWAIDASEFAAWQRGRTHDATDLNEVSDAVDQLQTDHERVVEFLADLAVGVSSFEWRTAGFPGLDETTRRTQALYRAGTGYKEVHKQLLLHLAEHGGRLSEESARLAAARWPDEDN